MRARVAILAAGLVLALPATSSASEPHLFIDRGEIAHTSGVRRVIEHPQRGAAPITTPDDKNFQPDTTVLHLGPHRWSLYYNALEKDAAGLDTSQAAMLTSTDGVHWGGMRLLDLPTPV